jgi:hypothetical protein
MNRSSCGVGKADATHEEDSGRQQAQKARRPAGRQADEMPDDQRITKRGIHVNEGGEMGLIILDWRFAS